jgi:hypothetical protein
MLIHKEDKGQISYSEGKAYCTVCDKEIKPYELEEVDDSPSPFSG